MDAKRLRELRHQLEGMHCMPWCAAEYSECAGCTCERGKALAIIDAELAQADGVCVWKHVKGSRDTYETCRSVFSGSPEVICPDCGKRVEVI